MQKRNERTHRNNRGFSLLEVLLGLTVFMIGMMGVTALNISSLKANTFAGNMSEATILAASKIEQLMGLDFDDTLNKDDPDDPDGTGADGTSNNGVDESGENFGLDDCPSCVNGEDADHEELTVGRNGMYTIYWNVAEGEPTSADTKRINVIVVWDIKGVVRRMNINTIRMKND